MDIKRIFLAIISFMILFSFSSCGDENMEVVSVSIESETSDKIVTEKPNILVVGCSDFKGDFNPFFAEALSDKNVVDMVFDKLLTFDRQGILIEKGIDGEEASYNGKKYSYKGLSDINIKYNSDLTAVVTVTLRNDIKFSDGETMDADDVIFSMYVLSDKSYNGPITFYNLPIKGMTDYRKGKSKSVEGITKKNDSTIVIDFEYFDNSMLSSLSIPIVPLHYYGDEDMYDYDNNEFGFKKGDISSVNIKNNVPLGTGAYKFDKYKNGIVYLERNKDYFKGEPKINFIEFRNVDESKCIQKILDGEIHIADITFNKAVEESIKKINGGSLDGTVLKTYAYDNIGYGYIGISADSVKVGAEKDSNESKYLRKALATVFSVYREDAINEYFGESAEVINYPVSNSFWAAPKLSDGFYEIAFSKSINNFDIYKSDMTQEEKYSAALDAAKAYLIAAGYYYDIETSKFIAPPEGASMTYEIMVLGDGIGDHPAYKIFENARIAFEKLGLKLVINDIKDLSQLWNALDNGNCEIWAAAWDDYSDNSIYQLYHSSNIDGKGGTNSNDYDISDKELDSYIAMALSSTDIEFKKTAYKNCYETVLDWAVEVPLYQRKSAFVVNNYFVAEETMLSDYTANYTWREDIINLDINEILS